MIRFNSRRHGFSKTIIFLKDRSIYMGSVLGEGSNLNALGLYIL